MVYTNATSTLKGYINGVEAFSVAKSGTPQAPSGRTLNVAITQNLGYTGHISNLRIVRGTAVYTANFTPPTQPLTAVTNTSLLTCQSSTHVDNSTNSFAVTAFGDARPTQTNPFGFTSGNRVSYTPTTFGGSMSFDGTGDYLTLPLNSAFAIGTADFTLETWVYPTTTNQVWSVIFVGVNFGTSSDWGLYLGSGTTALFPRFQFTNTGSDNITSSTAVRQNEWSHIAVTRRAGTARMFINGRQTATANASTWSLTNALQKGIAGGFNGNANTLMTGHISDLRVISGTALYTANFVPPVAPVQPISNTVLMLPGTSAAVYDSSTQNNLETAGDAKVDQLAPYNAGYYSNFFDGTGDFLTLPTSTALGPTTGDYTWEAWLNPTALGTNKMIYASSQTTGALAIGIGSSTANRLTVFRSGVAFDFVGTTDMSVYLNRWVHVAVTKQSGTTRFWIDGVNTDTFTTNHTYFAGSTAASIGRRLAVAEDYTGSISNMRLVNGTAVYTANFTPPTQPLTAVTNTSLLTCQSNRFVDNSTNNFAITRNGDVRVQTQNPFQNNIGQSYSFDGTGDYVTTSGTYMFGTSPFTIETWIYPTAYPASSWAGICGNINTGTGNSQILLSIKPGGFVGFLTWNTWIIDNTTVSAPLNTWTHVAVTFNGTTYRLFLNGTQVGSSTTVFNLNTAGAFNVGYSGNTGIFNFTGSISDLRVTRGNARYTANFTPPATLLQTK
jgi:hypothetical protein